MLKKIVIVSFLIEKVNSIIMLIVPFIIENVNSVIKQIVSFMIENGNSETENRILVPPGFCDITIKNAIFAPIYDFLVVAQIATFSRYLLLFSVKFTISLI